MDAACRRLTRIVAAIVALGFVAQASLAAGLNSAQRKELAAIKSVLYKIHVPIRREAIPDAEQKVTDAQQRLDALVTETALPADDSHFTSVTKLIASRKESIAKAREKSQPGAKKADRERRKAEQGVSFVGQVAPIIKARCLGCHGKDAKGGLRLDTFAGFEKGGRSGPLLVIGDANNSLLMGRLLASNDARMPKGGEPLSEADGLAIAEWINRGAKFDGDDPAKPLDKLMAGATAVAAAPTTASKAKTLPASKIGIPAPKGGETVAFTRDIAPILVNHCVRCHSGADPKGGLSMETFELLWAGGKSGPVIEPGQLAKSRLWQLAGEQKPFKMPPGDERITKSDWTKLQTWISEGAAFDGSDPKRKLASLVPSEIERRKSELAQTSAAELHQRRRSQSDEQWRRTFPRTDPARVENDDFIILGNVSPDRLNAAARFAADSLRSSQEFVGDTSKPAFKGGLAVFVLKDRNSFEEFSQTVEKREAPATIHAAAVITPDLKDAYVVVEDRENSAEVATGGQGGDLLRRSLVEQLTAALLKRADKKLPDWIVAGSGRVAGAGGSQPALLNVDWPALYRLVGSLEKSEDLMSDGTFSTAAIGDVGEALVAFLIEKRGQAMFTRFAQKLASGARQADALQDVYGVDPQELADEFIARAARSAHGNAK